MGEATTRAPSRAKVIAGFATVYLLWGSTYLAIRIGVRTIPPFVMGAMRFLIAGSVLYLLVRSRERVRPTLVQWRAAAIVGGLLLVGGNGAVVWAEQRVPSGITSLLVAMVPLWMVLLDWARPRGRRPTAVVMIGVVVGLVGLLVLVNPFSGSGSGVDLVGAGVLLVGSFCWAAGSVYSKHAPLPSSPLLGTAMEMLAGGVLLVVAAALTGELGAFEPSAVSMHSALSVLYLVVFGSLVGFSTYIWLLRVATPSAVSTYAYVNPVVAVFLGWLVLSEPLSPRTLVAAAVIVLAVALITLGQRAAPSVRGQGPGGRGRRGVGPGGWTTKQRVWRVGD